MIGKSIWAVAAGVLFIIVVTTLVDIALHAMGVYPPMNQPINDSLALLATFYLHRHRRRGRLAHRAPRARQFHEACADPRFVGTILGLVGVVATWNAGLGPRWYPIALMVLAIPQCWGGKLYEMRKSAAPVWAGQLQVNLVGRPGQRPATTGVADKVGGPWRKCVDAERITGTTASRVPTSSWKPASAFRGP
jgi:hypothetical protein